MKTTLIETGMRAVPVGPAAVVPLAAVSAMPCAPVAGVLQIGSALAASVALPVRAPMQSDDTLWRAKRMARFHSSDATWRETVGLFRNLNVFVVQTRQHGQDSPKLSVDDRRMRVQEFCDGCDRVGITSRDLRDLLSVSCGALSNWRCAIDPVPERLLTCVREASGREHARYLFCDLVAKDVAEYCEWHPYFQQALVLRKLLKDAGTTASKIGIESAYVTGQSRADPFLAIMRTTPPEQWREAIALRRTKVRVPAPYRDDLLNRGLRDAPGRLSIPKGMLVGFFGVTMTTFNRWCSGISPVPLRAREAAMAVCAAHDAEDLTARLRTVGPVPPAVRKASTRLLTAGEQQQLRRLMETYQRFVLSDARSRLFGVGLDGSRAEDIAQEVWLACANTIRRRGFQGENVRAWLRDVVRTRVVDLARKVLGRRRNGEQLAAVTRRLGRPPTEEDLISRYNMLPEAAHALLAPHRPRRHVPLPKER